MSHSDYDLTGLPAIEMIIKLFKEYTGDIEHWDQKEWLTTAIKSNIETTTGFPREVIGKTVDLIFLAGNI